MAVMEITVIVAGTGKPGASEYVAEILKFIEKKGFKYTLTAMGTIVEGPADELFKLAAEVHKIPFTMGVPRVITLVRVDERKDKELTIEGKVQAVKEKIGKFERGL